ncbi:MAG: leucine-rich repeat protein [Alphaproteobacteria bacterium]|nr:leucine-rich repeat protein [Alphaproteobacteria bacterium]
MKCKKFTLCFMIFCLQINAATGIEPSSGTCNADETCLWKIDENGIMTVYAKEGAKNVVMDDYYCYDSCPDGNRPWESSIRQVQNLVIGDNIVKIGQDAFQNAYVMQTVSGMKDVETVGVSSFAYTYGLQSIEMPNVRTVGHDAFQGDRNLSGVDMPKVETIGYQAFLGASGLIYAGIKDSTNVSGSAFNNTPISSCGNGGSCGSCGDLYLQSGVGCVSSCYDNFYADNFGICREIKTRYTLPEADAATSNDNENMIEWIFE